MNELDYLIVLSRFALRFPYLEWKLQKVFKIEEKEEFETVCITVFNDGEFVKLEGFWRDVIPNFVIIAPIEIKRDSKLLKYTVWIFTTTDPNHIHARVTTKWNGGFLRTCFIWRRGSEEKVYLSLEKWLTKQYI